MLSPLLLTVFNILYSLVWKLSPDMVLNPISLPTLTQGDPSDSRQTSSHMLGPQIPRHCHPKPSPSAVAGLSPTLVPR